MIDMRNKMYAYDPDASPFLTILSQRVPAMRAGNPVYLHLEDQPLPWWDTGNEALDTTETGVDVVHPEYFRANDFIFIPTTGEYMKVTSVSGSTLTVIRNVTGDQTTGVAIAATSGWYISILGSVFEEGTTSRAIRSTVEATVTNYTQIHKTTFGGTNTLAASDLYAGKDPETQRRKNATQHAFELERLFLFGKKSERTGAGGHKERTTGGLVSWLSTNVTTVSGSLTDLVLETFASTLFRYSKQPKLVLASRLFATQLDQMAASRLQVVPKEDTFGVAVKRFVSSHGDLLVTIDDMLINDFSGWAIAVDLQAVAKRYLVDKNGARDSRLETNLQANDADQWNDQYLSEVGLHVFQEAKHGILKGIA